MSCRFLSRNNDAHQKVTILISLYQSGQFIEAKLRSLERLKCLDDAWIVFLICQNLDDELSRCEEFARGRTNVLNIVFDDYVPLYPTWNVGIQNTNSDYICNSNADDILHDDYLQRCCEYLDNHQDIAIVSTGVKITDRPNQTGLDWYYRDTMPKHIYPLSSAGPSPMWRRSLHAKYDYFGNYKVIGDARFWEKLLAGNEKFGLIQDDLVLYYLSPESLEHRADPETGILLRDIDLAQN